MEFATAGNDCQPQSQENKGRRLELLTFRSLEGEPFGPGIQISEEGTPVGWSQHLWGRASRRQGPSLLERGHCHLVLVSPRGWFYKNWKNCTLGSATAWEGNCRGQGEEASLDDVGMDHQQTGSNPEGANPFFLFQPCSLPLATLLAEVTWSQNCGLQSPSPCVTKLRMEGPLGAERQ